MRLPYLDSLKGFGAYIVLFSHYYLAFNIENYNLLLFHRFSPFSILVNGNWAVCLFIMLSSFSIIYRLENNKVEYLKNVIIKRYFRLAIPIVFILVIIYMMSLIDLFYNSEVSYLVKSNWLANFYNHKIGLYDFVKECVYVVINGKSELDPPLWMINYIFFGTFLTLLVSVVIKDILIKKKILILFILAFYLYNISVYYSCIVLGYILYCIHSQNIINGGKISIYINLLSFLGFILLPLCIHTPLSNSVSAFLFLCIVIRNIKIQQLLSGNCTVFLGKISYQLYLIHWPVLCSVSCFAFIKFLDIDIVVLHLIVFLLFVFVSSILAWIITKYMEPIYNFLTMKIVNAIMAK